MQDFSPCSILFENSENLEDWLPDVVVSNRGVVIAEENKILWALKVIRLPHISEYEQKVQSHLFVFSIQLILFLFALQRGFFNGSSLKRSSSLLSFKYHRNQIQVCSQKTCSKWPNLKDFQKLYKVNRITPGSKFSTHPQKATNHCLYSPIQTQLSYCRPNKQ